MLLEVDDRRRHFALVVGLELNAVHVFSPLSALDQPTPRRAVKQQWYTMSFVFGDRADPINALFSAR
jgi:hypothetical protein